MSASSQNPPLPVDWQLLGELELPVGSTIESALHTWLVELLAPFRLQSNFLNKVLASMQESTGRVMQLNTEGLFEHVHLSVFAPEPQSQRGKTWGFFRIVKIDRLEKQKDHLDHAVEIYLYPEGS